MNTKLPVVLIFKSVRQRYSCNLCRAIRLPLYGSHKRVQGITGCQLHNVRLNNKNCKTITEQMQETVRHYYYYYCKRQINP